MKVWCFPSTSSGPRGIAWPTSGPTTRRGEARGKLLCLAVAVALIGCGGSSGEYSVERDVGADIRALGSDDLETSEPAADRLVAMGPDAVSALKTALGREPPAVRLGVVEVLGASTIRTRSQCWWEWLRATTTRRCEARRSARWAPARRPRRRDPSSKRPSPTPRRISGSRPRCVRRAVRFAGSAGASGDARHRDPPLPNGVAPGRR